MMSSIPTQPATTSSNRLTAEVAGHKLSSHLRQTAQFIRLMDIVVWTLACLVTLMLVWLAGSVVDHWLYAFPRSLRWLIWLATVVGISWMAASGLIPLILRRVNPTYAAARIEQLVPEFKNSLITWHELESHPELHVPKGIMAAISFRAIKFLGGQEPASTVDTGPLIKLLAVTGLLIVSLAAYAMLSPKSLVASGHRLAMPWADVEPPTRVRILEVTPGDVELTFGSPLDVEVDTRGLRSGDTIVVRYDSMDGQISGREVPLQASVEGLRYAARIQTGAAGIDHEIQYWVEAGDARSGPYRVSLNPLPSVALKRIQVEYPAYTRLAPQDFAPTAEIEAPEGSTLRIWGTSNQRIGRARLILNPELDSTGAVVRGTDTIDLQVDSQNVEGASKLYQHHQSFCVRVHNASGDGNLHPVTLPLNVFPDVAPEIVLVGPESRTVRVGPKSRMTLEIRASDPDFGLSQVQIDVRATARPTISKTLFEQSNPDAPPVMSKVLTLPLSLASLGVKPGDRIEIVATARDNRHDPLTGAFNPNQRKSQPLTLEVVAPEQEEIPPELQRRSTNQPDDNSSDHSDNTGGTQPDPDDNPSDQQGAKASSEETQSQPNAQQEKSSQHPSEESNSPQDGSSQQGGSPQEKGQQSGESSDGTQQSEEKGSQNGSGGAGGQSSKEQQGENANSQQSSGQSSSGGGSKQSSEDNSQSSNNPSGDGGSKDSGNANAGSDASDSTSNAQTGRTDGKPGSHPQGNSRENGSSADSQASQGDQRADVSQPNDRSSNGQQARDAADLEKLKKFIENQKDKQTKPGSTGKPNEGKAGQGGQSGDKRKNDFDSKSENAQPGEQSNAPDAQSGDQPDGGGSGDQEKSRDGHTDQPDNPSNQQPGDKQSDGSSSTEKSNGQNEKTRNVQQGKSENKSQPDAGDSSQGGAELSDRQKPRDQQSNDSQNSDQQAGQKGNNDQASDGQANGEGQQNGDRSQSDQSSQAEQNSSQQDSGQQEGATPMGGESGKSQTPSGGSSSPPNANQQSPQNSSQNSQGGGQPGQGQVTSNSNSGQASGEGSSVSEGAPTDDKFANQSTDLTLDYLQRQREQPDPELLREMNWTKQDLDDFVQRYQSARDLSAQATPLEPNRDSLDHLNIGRTNDSALGPSGRADDFSQQLDAGGRVRPPQGLQKRVDAFQKAIGKPGQGRSSR